MCPARRSAVLTVIVTASALVGIYEAANAGSVGPTDTCPMPTPYPPAAAGAGTIFNGNMEGGFTNGSANQWSAWKDATYNTVQVHLIGDDRKFEGSYSQKLYLPQPPPNFFDQEAGLYQQIWVVPGATYTATAKFYLQALNQSYPGEDLVAEIGLDPFGQDNGDGSGMVRSPRVSQDSVWVTATVTAKAVLPVMTLGVKGTRKWAQHGYSDFVWIDAVTFTGPVPTGTRPGPEPVPADPESLIPPTVGPDLVTNWSFEDPFTNGVGTEWNKWSTAGAGTWKRSQRVGKVGGARYDCGSLDALGQMNAKTVLFMTGNPENGGGGVMGDIVTLVNNFPMLEDSIIVGRPFFDDSLSTYESNPTFYGRRLADLLVQKYSSQPWWPRVDAWQGLNEPDWGDHWQRGIL